MMRLEISVLPWYNWLYDGHGEKRAETTPLGVDTPEWFSLDIGSRRGFRGSG